MQLAGEGVVRGNQMVGSGDWESSWRGVFCSRQGCFQGHDNTPGLSQKVPFMSRTLMFYSCQALARCLINCIAVTGGPGWGIFALKTQPGRARLMLKATDTPIMYMKSEQSPDTPQGTSETEGEMERRVQRRDEDYYCQAVLSSIFFPSFLQLLLK